MPFSTKAGPLSPSMAQNPPAIVAPARCSREMASLIRIKPTIDSSIRLSIPILGKEWKNEFSHRNAHFRVVTEPSSISQLYNLLCAAQKEEWSQLSSQAKQDWLKDAKFRAIFTLPSNAGHEDERLYRDFAYFEANGRSFLLYCQPKGLCWKPMDAIGRFVLPNVNLGAIIEKLDPEAVQSMVQNVIKGSTSISVYKSGRSTKRQRAELTNADQIKKIQTLFSTPIPKSKQISFLCTATTGKPTYSLLFFHESQDWTARAPTLLMASVCEAAEGGQVKVNVYIGFELLEVYPESNVPMAGFSISEQDWKELVPSFERLKYKNQ